MSLHAKSQLVSLDNQKIHQHVKYNLKYKKPDGNYYGDGFSIDGNNVIVVFKNVVFDKSKNQFTVSGTTYHTVADDEARINGVQIFVAKPKRNRLIGIRVIGFSKTDEKKEGTDGDFKISFERKKGESLFFEAGNNFYLLQYDIEKALSE
jgi:hypothetical protein